MLVNKAIFQWLVLARVFFLPPSQPKEMLPLSTNP